MKFEQWPTADKPKEPILLTKEEFDLLASFSTDPNLKEQLMKEKGINFDDGDIAINVDGKIEMMTTRSDDFGTILEPETVEERYGPEKKKEIFG